MRFLFSIFVILFLFSLQLPFQAYAADCQPIYGGGETCLTNKILLSKKVFNPETETFVDNLGTNDPKYHPGDTIKFQVTITNTSNTSLSKLTLIDTLPDTIVFQDGPGTYNKTNNTISINIPSISSGKSQIYTITAKILDENVLPKEENICNNNQVEIKTEKGDNAHAASQFCIEQTGTIIKEQTAQVKNTPKTGQEIFLTLLLAPSLLTGFYLIRITK